MSRVYSLYSTSVGKKFTMAVSGAIFVLFVIVHMFGNLKVYLGPEAFNHYAEGLRGFGEPFLGHEWFLWAFRAGLIAALLIHVLAAWQTSRQSWAARGHKYRKRDNLVFHYASRTMRWGGVALFLFIVYHILHLTTGTLHPDFVPGDAYHNFVTGFRSVPVVVIYSVAMIALGLHLYHGTWSAFQTMGVDGPRINRWREPIALGVALIVVLVNLSFPVAVYTGIIH
ncbi:MAG: succinate dehydrogenase cytochrome b subunit [Candidatus Palauibacterales bacterium]|jgi:succinate dehydrogenase cytochrome b subunit|nr:succinate dehydrogenase cytochrome b subunit [Candidatus Palauibacterales bacterium]MDP2481910.1 succinate dehydrogenase cytochrome b subunit [Candidatus Palauibacterales bacterium]